MKYVKWFIGVFVFLCLVGEGVQGRELGIDKERIKRVVGLMMLEAWLLGG